MSRPRIAPVVEGHGEVAAVRILLERTWAMLGGEFVSVLRPVQEDRRRLVVESVLSRAVRLACEKLNNPPVPPDPGLVLIVIDADEACPAELGPKRLEWGRKAAYDADVACVVANLEYETWFVASAESLTKFLDLPPGFVGSEDPEGSRHKKAWIEQRIREKSYSPTRHQPAMTKEMNLALCRRRSPSLDKLCRDLEQRLTTRDSRVCLI